MKVIIIIGSTHSGYKAVEHTLNQAGIANAQGGSKASLSPQALQTELLRSYEVDLSGDAPMAQVQPGKLWNELATDLFLANMQQPNWGWADSQSAVLMDFWHDFDAQVRLLLIYNSPADHLAQVLFKNTQPSAQQIAVALDEWVHWNTALLRYLHRHPDYCLLVSSEHAAQQPLNFLDVVAAHWQISGLNNAAITLTSAPAYQRLQAHFINQLIDPHHPSLALLQELEGAALLPAASSTDHAADAAPNARENWADWAKLRANLAQLAHENAKLITNSADSERARDELGLQFEQYKTQLAQATKASSQSSLECAELKQENELLLLQLHQVQEELESHFLKNQALSQAAEQSEHLKKDLASLQTLRDSLTKEKTELIKGRDTQAKLLQERQTQLDLAAKAQETANKAKEQQAKLVADLHLAVATLQTQKEQLTKEINTLTQTKDTETKAKAEALAQRDLAVINKAALIQERDALQAEKGSLIQQLEQHKAQLAQTNKASAQTNQSSMESGELILENELLLLQLHQVQEELEHYFLRHQELEKGQNSKLSSFVTDFWRMHQPEEMVISMLQDIAGSNWYPAESDGRWAGPATLSTLQMPPMQPGSYKLELDIVDAMNPGIVNDLVVEALGQILPVEVFYPIYQGEYPLICSVHLNVSQATAQQAWPLNLRFSQTVCPADNGSDDMRNLSVRLRTLKLVKHV